MSINVRKIAANVADWIFKEDDMIWDLLKSKYAADHRLEAVKLAEQHKDAENKTRFEVGDIITFWSGYNNDIRVRSEIMSINGDNIYVLWDCYWFPIRDDEVREVEK